ncbi:hypothetical protein LF845_00330 [Deferribacterales bacterium Es71-Z0220]|uniref:hypothetical protein n=1 Tax=Deferrivibrio essentukiensis TaxID=2880922 RepID=UPI001F619192|nr:hypothetical protein [Deferrivibrio essentukiensis]MCB4203400.1 hypothetical protein [Deferrivibrio essentukiensis]
MGEPKPTCSICAWRATCNKKYSIADPSKCLDYARDLTIEIKTEGKEEQNEDKDRDRN